MLLVTRSSVLCWVAGLALVCATSAVGTSQQGESSGSHEPVNVGMVALLASPQTYDGKMVRTVGFLCLEFEGNAVYLHEEDYRYRMTKNAFELNLSKTQEVQFKKLSLKYVLIEGTVQANQGEAENSISSGSIGNVTRLEYWRPRGRLNRLRLYKNFQAR